MKLKSFTTWLWSTNSCALHLMACFQALAFKLCLNSEWQHLQFHLGQPVQAEKNLRNCFILDPSLATQDQYLAQWLNLFNDDPQFGLFAASCFPNGRGSQFEAAQLERAVSYYRNRDLPKARDFALRSIRMDLRNATKRVLIGTLIQASSSPNLYKFLRSLRKGSTE